MVNLNVDIIELMNEKNTIFRGLSDFEYYWLSRIAAESLVDAILTGKWKITRHSLSLVLEQGVRYAHICGLVIPLLEIKSITCAKQVRALVRDPKTPYEPWIPFQSRLISLVSERWNRL